MKISLADENYQRALPLLTTIESHGYEAYFVGGCIRDTLLGRPIHDVDIATSALPDEIEQLFKYTFDVGKAHGTIVVLYGQQQFEVTTFRTEGAYSDARRPDQVNFVRNLVEDTLRRDFTMNALAANYQGDLFDYHGGYQDIQARLIRAVGVAKERFSEDALRMIRAIRFASQLGFAIEADTMQAIQELAPKLALISVERIRIELTKCMQGDFFSEYAQLLIDSHLFDFTLLNQYSPQLVQRLAAWLKPYMQAGMERSEVLVWALLVKACELVTPKACSHFLKEWKQSNQLIQDVIEIQLIFDLIETGGLDLKQLYRVKMSNLELVQTFYQLQGQALPTDFVTLKQQLPIQSRQELAIDGQKLMAILGLTKGGKIVGTWLDEIEEQVLCGNLPNQLKAIHTYLMEHGQNIR